MASPIVLAVNSTKGGVGKTTIACGVASALERLGKRVLVVDVDPNGDTSTALGINPMREEKIPGAYDLLLGRKPIPLVVDRGDDHARKPSGICILPGDERLVGHEISSLFPEALKIQLKAVVHPTANLTFDAIVLDLPTAPRQLINLGLRAATSAAHVLDAHMFAVKKTEDMLAQCAEWSSQGFDIVRRHCVVANRINGSRRRDKELLEYLPEVFAAYPQVIVRQDEALARATSAGLLIHDVAGETEATQALTAIALWAIEAQEGNGHE